MSEPGRRRALTEIDRDRRAEGRLIPQALIALVVVGVIVAIREVFAV